MTSRPYLVATLILIAAAAPSAWAQDEFDREPILYSTAPESNPVSQIQARLNAGETVLKHEPHFGYLRSVLQALNVPESSQMLVFSKTSLQRSKIAPRTPRSIYFSDESYVGFCQAGDVIEISVADPQLGTCFYTLDQKASEAPRFVRQGDSCLTCHTSSSTHGLPGHLVRSVFTDTSGFPILSAGGYRVDHTTPMEHRWGGWYVTGTHGPQNHLGNLIVQGDEVKEPVDNSKGRNVTSLADFVDVENFLTPHSDLVALMVMEHQTQAHNALTRANFVTRQALHHEAALNRELGEPADHRWESTNSRIRSGGDPLVKCLLMSEEAKLTAPIQGTCTFATEFAARGPRDSKGRSLRDLDLQTRLFRYPCSYLIYSASFDSLPAEVKDYVLAQLLSVLTGKNTSKEFAHLTPADRQTILEILRETKPGLPAAWFEVPKS